MLKYSLVILLFSSVTAFSQADIHEINDIKIRERVQLIRERTDSFVKKYASPSVYRQLQSYFQVSYLVGDRYYVYSDLNQAQNVEPNDIHSLVQYYILNDSAMGVNEFIRIRYFEIISIHGPEINKVEVAFDQNCDYKKIQALNYLYKPTTSQKRKRIIHSSKLIKPYIQLHFNNSTNSFYIFLKGVNKPHNYLL